MRVPAVHRSVGVGLRSPHIKEVLSRHPSIGWFEVHAENYMCDAPALAALEKVRETWPVSLHGVALSLGGADAPDAYHLSRLKELVDRLEPVLISEHMAWSVIDGAYINDLLPFPLTEETLSIMTSHVEQVQDALGRSILIENPAGYLRFRHSTMGEAAFLTALTERTGCGILCDVNNICVSAHNTGIDPSEYLGALPKGAVGEVHLAGHTTGEVGGRPFLIDNHGSRVHDEVWALYRDAMARFGNPPSLVEWDNDLPPFDVLLEEAARACDLLR